MKYNEDHHVEQPIDYSLKYSEASSKKAMFRHSKPSSTQGSVKDHLSQNSSSSVASLKNQGRQKQLHPSSAQSRAGPTRAVQKNAACKAPTINQETLQTYCVEDTPICFSRGSSLSSLSSEEDEMESCKRNVNSANNYPTLPISEKNPLVTLHLTNAPLRANHQAIMFASSLHDITWDMEMHPGITKQ